MSYKAVVTGGSQGIGLAITERLSEATYEVFVLDISGKENTIQCDVSDEAAVARTAEEIGPVDLLVNNAGIWKFGPIEETTLEDFSRVLDVNLKGAFNTIKHFGLRMLEAGNGSIVNIVSIAAKHPNPSVGSYGPSKAALVSLTEQVAIEWGPRGVRCNGVGVGLVPTPGTNDVYISKEVRDFRSKSVPLNRLGSPNEIAEAVYFLASEKSSYINGHILNVDGGLGKALMTLLPRPEDLE
ncbi:MAG: hypothetical protein CL461_00710 [Acidimicrobiaceae bacterium]|nr:hypothetical protein [Acidimicrobiaceae bacterium]